MSLLHKAKSIKTAQALSSPDALDPASEAGEEKKNPLPV